MGNYKLQIKDIQERYLLPEANRTKLSKKNILCGNVFANNKNVYTGRYSVKLYVYVATTTSRIVFTILIRTLYKLAVQV